MALTPEEQQELQQLEAAAGFNSMAKNTIGNQIGAGVDTGQALLQRAGQALSEVIGYGDSEFAVNMIKDAERNERRAARVPVEGLGDQVLRGIGTIGVAAGPTIASLPLGGGAVTAATVLTSAGLNLGDIKTKSIELDPESTAGLQDVVAATALGGLEAIPLARFKRALSPVSDGVRRSVAQKIGSVTADIGKASAVGGATEGAQDFATSVLAYNFTDNIITDEALDKIIDDSINEAIVGAILSGPIGASESTIKSLQNNQALKDAANFAEDETGIYYNEPVEDKLQNPGLFKRGVANVVGRAPDKIIVSPIGGLASTKEFMGNFVQLPTDAARRKGVVTVSNESQLMFQDMFETAGDFFNATEKDAQAAVTARRAGTIPESPTVLKAYNALSALFDGKTKELAESVGMAELINWRGENYIPLMNVDVGKVVSDPEAFRRAAYQDVLDNGGTVEDARIAAAQANVYAKNVGENGFYHYGAKSNSYIAEAIAKQMDDATTSLATGADPEAVYKKLSKGLRSVDTSKTRTDNPFEQERFLSQLSESFWENYTTDDVKGNVYAYAKSTAERAAHVKKFGVNNEKYWVKVKELIAEAVEKGIPVTNQDVKNFIDVINVSQRIPTRTISAKTRKWTNRVRAFENMTLLPLAILPSLAEAMIVSNRSGTVTGLTATGKTIKDSVGNHIKKAVGSNKIQQTVADDLGLSFAEAQNVLSSRLNEDSFTITKMEQRFFNLTLLPQFTEFLRMTAANAAYKTFVRDANTFLSTSNKGVKRNLVRKFGEAGLDANKVADWIARTREGDPRADAYYRDYIRPALLNVVDDTVVNPRPISRPLWTSDQRLQLLGQMKSFALIFGNTVMRNWYNKLTSGGITQQTAAVINILPLIATMMVFQVYMAGVREFLKTGDTERWEDADFWDHFLTGFSYLGMGGFISDPIKASSYGVDPTSTLLGPAASDLNRSIKAISPILNGEVSPEDMVDSVVKRLTRSFPDFGVLDE